MGLIYLTPHSPISNAPVSDPSGDEAGAPAIVVTNEMARAGVDAFLNFHPREDDPEWIVADVFRAMLRLSPGRLRIEEKA